MPALRGLTRARRLLCVLFGLVVMSGASLSSSIWAEALPEPLSGLPDEHLEPLRQELLRLPEPPQQPGLTKDDALGALGVCLLVFLSTFPPVIPFLIFGDVQTALRTSNAVAIVMLFVCGYAYGRGTGLRPWATGLVMVAIGIALVAVAVALGG